MTDTPNEIADIEMVLRMTAAAVWVDLARALELVAVAVPAEIVETRDEEAFERHMTEALARQAAATPAEVRQLADRLALRTTVLESHAQWIHHRELDIELDDIAETVETVREVLGELAMLVGRKIVAGALEAAAERAQPILERARAGDTDAFAELDTIGRSFGEELRPMLELTQADVESAAPMLERMGVTLREEVTE